MRRGDPTTSVTQGGSLAALGVAADCQFSAGRCAVLQTQPVVGGSGLGGTGLFDFGHGYAITNPGVPVWWPRFCLTYDIVAAGYLAQRLHSAKVAAQPL